MPATLSEIFSDVQRKMGDEAVNVLQRAEYVDQSQNICYDVFNQIRLWVDEQTITPIPSIKATYTSLADFQADSFVSGDVGSVAIVTDATTGITTYYEITAIGPLTFRVIEPNICYVRPPLEVVKILRVVRGAFEAREHSLQSVLKADRLGYNFDINDTTRTGYEFNTLREADGTTKLVFSKEFEIAEQVVVTYLQERPFWPARWRETISIPYFLTTTIEWGLVWKLSEILFMRGDERFQSRAVYAKKQYDGLLRDATAYSRNFLDERSNPKAQPRMWLPEN